MTAKLKCANTSVSLSREILIPQTLSVLQYMEVVSVVRVQLTIRHHRFTLFTK